MNDKKRLEDELEGLDWDAELADWEERTFPAEPGPREDVPLTEPPAEGERTEPVLAAATEPPASAAPEPPPEVNGSKPAPAFTQEHGAPLSGEPLWGEGDELDLSAIDAFFEQSVSGVKALADATVAEADASAVARGITDRARSPEAARPPPFRAPMPTPPEETRGRALDLTAPPADASLRPPEDPHPAVVPVAPAPGGIEGVDPDEDTAVFRASARLREARKAVTIPPVTFASEPGTGQRFPDEEETTIFASSTRRPRATTSPGDEAAVESSARTTHTATAAPPAPARPVMVPPVTGAAGAELLERAEWLESEARAQKDRLQRARSLLVVSEILAMVGEVDRAGAIAREASLLAPQVAMATRQARSLSRGTEPARGSGPGDPGLELFDLEARHAPTPAAKLHATLLAADRQRLAGNDTEAASRWDQASRVPTSDVRAPLARIARALARGETPRLVEGAQPEPLARAVQTAMRLRGGGSGALNSGAKVEPGDALARARDAIARRDFEGAARAVAALRQVPGLASGASWLAAAFGAQRPGTRAAAVGWLEEAPEAERPATLRAASALALELGDTAALERLLDRAGEAFAPLDRAALAALLQAPSLSREGDEALLRAEPSLRVVVSALAGVRGPEGGFGQRSVGAPRASRALALGRLLSAGAPAVEVDEVLFAMAGDHDAETRAVALEMALRGGQVDEVSDALGSFRDPGGAEPAPSDRQLAAGFVAERVGDRARAVAAYRAALELDPASEVALRARMATEGELDTTDLTRCLELLAASTDDHVLASFALLEAVAREPYLAEQHREGLLEASHRATPDLTLGPFLAEEQAIRSGQREVALGWVRARRSSSEDPVERAFFELREARLTRNSDAPPLAVHRLEAALAARPHDRSLEDALGRLPGGSGSPGVGVTATPAALEERALRITGTGRAADLLVAAYGYEREGDFEGARRAAASAKEALGTPGGVDAALVAVALERLEVASGNAASLAEGLLNQARSAVDPGEQRLAYERLADLDAQRGDTASALLWHRSILDSTPDHLPSLRHVEHALLGEGRGEELEPIALGIARALGEAGAGETSAHAALAVRLRMRGATGEWEPTRAPTELAAFLPDAPLWALRGANAHARVHADDEWLARTSLGLAERTQRPLEVAALVLRAAEAATRRGALEAARALLERASHEDQGDVVAWAELAFVCRRLGDPRAAAEAWESVARTSMVEGHQASAWYQAGCLWLDEVRDVERGTRALEQVAAVDISYGDVVQRLGMLYGQRGSRGELASLLERRLALATTDFERLSLENERGRALLAMGDPAAAREAFEAALALATDQHEALAGLADAAAAEEDWPGVEQALVRLARVVVEPAEHQRVYRRLSALYMGPLVNLTRAERALREVLRRAPGDAEALTHLVEVYLRMREPVQAVEMQRELLQQRGSDEEKRARRIKLAALYEDELHEARKAEQALEDAREEAPWDPELLRLLVGLYRRHQQTPATGMALERAVTAARKALEDDTGEAAPPLRLLRVALELGGRDTAAAIVRAALLAVEGGDDEAPAVRPWNAGNVKPALDERLAPEALAAPVRELLMRRGDLLDAAAPLDQGALGLAPLEAGPLLSSLVALGATLRVDGARVLLANELAEACVPVSSRPPTVAMGRRLAAVEADPAVRTFLVARALKLVQARASVFLRVPPAPLNVLLAAWFRAHDPTFAPEEIPLGQLAEAQSRIDAATPRGLETDLRPLGREAAQAATSHLGALPFLVRCWANRTAFVVGGDLGAALRAIAQGTSNRDSEAPSRDTEVDAPNEALLASPEARDLLRFVTSEAYLTLE